LTPANGTEGGDGGFGAPATGTVGRETFGGAGIKPVAPPTFGGAGIDGGATTGAIGGVLTTGAGALLTTGAGIETVDSTEVTGAPMTGSGEAMPTPTGATGATGATGGTGASTGDVGRATTGAGVKPTDDWGIETLPAEPVTPEPGANAEVFVPTNLTVACFAGTASAGTT